MSRGLRKTREISDTKRVSVAVVAGRAGKVRMIAKGVRGYVSGGMKSNTMYQVGGEKVERL
jgi:hypothetical protein